MPVRIYRGTGSGDFSPNVPLTDHELGLALQRAGHRGTRTPGRCVWGSVDLAHAVDFAKGNDVGNVVVLQPEPGSLVSWIEGSKDAVVRFESWLHRLLWDPPDEPRGLAAFVRDIAGDVNTLETYLALKRQRRLIRHLLDDWVSEHRIRELEFVDLEQMEAELSGHEGEVWITGSYTARAVCEADLCGEPETTSIGMTR